MHHKVVVRDRETVWTGSTNWTDDSWSRQENVIVTVRSPEIGYAYFLAFGQLWEGGEVEGSGKVDPRTEDVDGARVRAWFCPEHGEALSHRVAKNIGKAQTRIRIASPVLTSGPILATLVEVVGKSLAFPGTNAFIGAHHGAEARAAVGPVRHVHDGGKADEVLARGPDRVDRELVAARAELLVERVLRLVAGGELSRGSCFEAADVPLEVLRSVDDGRTALCPTRGQVGECRGDVFQELQIGLVKGGPALAGGLHGHRCSIRRKPFADPSNIHAHALPSQKNCPGLLIQPDTGKIHERAKPIQLGIGWDVHPVRHAPGLDGRTDRNVKASLGQLGDLQINLRAAEPPATTTIIIQTTTRFMTNSSCEESADFRSDGGQKRT